MRQIGKCFWNGKRAPELKTGISPIGSAPITPQAAKKDKGWVSGGRCGFEEELKALRQKWLTWYAVCGYNISVV